MSKAPRLLNWEVIIAGVGITLGLAVSVILSPKNSFMFSNLLWFWVPQACVLALLLPFKLRPAITAGVAAVLALYLAIFGICVRLYPDGEGLVWLGYLFSFPGALAGALGAGFLLRKRPRYSILSTGCIAGSLVFAGIFINQAIVCNTVMYCGVLSAKAKLNPVFPPYDIGRN